jgi:pilus assembly protein Flp/PilA
MLTKLYARFQGWKASDEGATALEYGILVAFIAIVIIVGVTAFGASLNAFFEGLWAATGI